MDRILFHPQDIICSGHGSETQREIAVRVPVLTDRIHCTGGHDEAWIGIGTLASRGIQGTTHRAVPQRRPTIGQIRR